MSPIELTEEQRRLVEAEHGKPVDVIDPATNRNYVLLAREMYEKVRSVLSPEPGLPPEEGTAADIIPPGILRSQHAFWHDLPELLKTRRNQGKWVCYHGNRRIGIAGTRTELAREIHQKKIPRGEYYLAVIRPREIPPWQPEEIEPLGQQHFES